MTDEENRNLSILGDAASDFQDMDSTDRLRPRLKIVQAMTKSDVRGPFGNGDLADLKGRRLICKFGTKTDCVPLMFWKEWVKFNPKKNVPRDQMILGRSTDRNSDLAKLAGNWQANQYAPDAEGKTKKIVTECYNFVLLFPTATESWEQMFLFTFMRSAHKVGKQWLNRADMATVRGQKAPIWAYQYQFGATTATNADGAEFYIPDIGNSTLVPEDNWAYLLEASNSLKSMRKQLEEAAAASLDDEHGGQKATERNAEI